MFRRTLLSIPFLFASLVQSFANPGACSGACWSHDPAVVQRTSDGKYFRFSTGGGIEITTASSISGPWTIQGKALTSGSSINLSGNTDLWAPDVSKVGDLYYMYYAVSSFGSQSSAIGVATSSTMEVGSWTDHGSVGVTSSSKTSFNAIDPNLINVSGTYYLTFGSFWQDIFQVQMDSTAMTKGSSTAVNIAFNSTGTSAEEGGFVFYNSGYYYLLLSAGICCGYDTSKPAQGAEYRIVICRSSTATGGFVDKSGASCTSNGGTTLLASHGTVYGPGGQGVFNDTSLGLVLYYHYADTTGSIGDGSYKFGWNQLTFSDGWPVV